MAETPTPTPATKKPGPVTAAPTATKPKVGKSTTVKKSRVTGNVLWTTRLEQRWKNLRAQVIEVLKGLRSSDRETRKMSALFAFSLFGLLAVSTGMIRYFWIKAREADLSRFEDREQGRRLGEFLKRQADEARMKNTLISLGSFTVELKAVPDSHPAPGVMNLAELELVVQCDVRETCQYLEENLPQAKNQVTGYFVAIDREDLLSREGKRHIRRQLMDRLNGWLPKGRIEDLFFSKLIVD